MKFKAIVSALAVSLTILGCGGSGGSSANIYLRTVMLVHPALNGGLFGSPFFTINGSQTGNIDTQVNCPVITNFNLTTATTQSFTATDVTANPNINLGSVSETTTVPNAFYSLYITGIEGSSQYPPALAIVPETPPTPSTTAAQVRFLNFSTAANGPVDVYFTATASSALSGTTPTFSSVTYGSVPGTYVALPGGAYYVRVTVAGQPTNVLYTSSTTSAFVNGYTYSNFGWDTVTDTTTVVTQQDQY